jgi:hypothetical protein
MTDPRTDRIAAIARRLDELAPLEPIGVRLARQALERAQNELHMHLRRGMAQDVVEATRERVRRCHDLLEARWHDAAASVAAR